MTTVTGALQAYRTAQTLGLGPAQPPTKTAEADFGKMVKDALGAVVDKGRVAEQTSVALANGKASVVDVVTAIAETEVALETMVAVRDRVIAAYEEIMRMPI